MPIEKAEIGQFMELAKDFPVFDVRSPGEFLHAHIPGAHNLPLCQKNPYYFHPLNQALS